VNTLINTHNKNFRETVFNQESQDDFIKLNIINAIKAQAYFEKLKEDKVIPRYEYSVAQSKLRNNWRINKCRNQNKQCRDEVSIFSTLYHCTETKNYCFNQSRSIKDNEIKNTEQYLDKNQGPIHKVVQISPLLFNHCRKDNIIGVFPVSELTPSPFLKSITKNLNPTIVQDMKKLIIDKNEDGINIFFEKNKEKINQTINNKNTMKQIKEKAHEQLLIHLEKIDSSLHRICDSEGEGLHNYPGFVQKTFKELYKKTPKLTLQEINDKMISSQMAYCHLLNKYPPEEESVSLAAISGFTLIGVGAALQVIPIAGTATGTALVIAGGTVFAAQASYDTWESHKKYQQEIGLQSAGYIGYKKRQSSQKLRNQNLAWTAIDIIALPLDLAALRHFKGPTTKAIKNPNSEAVLLKEESHSISSTQRKSINENVLFKDYMNMYSNKDENEVALLIFIELKKKNPHMSDVDITKKFRSLTTC
jgi:hypothetical protein